MFSYTITKEFFSNEEIDTLLSESRFPKQTRIHIHIHNVDQPESSRDPHNGSLQVPHFPELQQLYADPTNPSS